MQFLDKHGWPVERIKGRRIQNFLRLLIHTRRIRRSRPSWKLALMYAKAVQDHGLHSKAAWKLRRKYACDTKFLKFCDGYDEMCLKAVIEVIEQEETWQPTSYDEQSP